MASMAERRRYGGMSLWNMSGTKSFPTAPVPAYLSGPVQQMRGLSMNAITTEDEFTFDHAVFHELEPGVPDAERYNGWTAEKQKRFLVALSRGHNIAQASAIVGMSRQSAYALRTAAKGAAFRLGWDAALLHARDVLADELMDRAFNGVREHVTADNGAITTRLRHDNVLAWRMLNRLDRRADTACADANAAAVRSA